MTVQAPVSTQKPTILIAIGALWPGNDSSGPNQSILGMARAFSRDFDIRIVARDRAFGAAARQATGAPSDVAAWNDIGFAHIRYCAVGPRGARDLRRLLRETPYDVLWLNGFFDREFTLPALMLRRLKLVPVKPTILSPRGEFAEGALGLKAARKSAYRALARRLGLLKDVTLHATSERECDDIRAGFPGAGRCAVAANVRPLIAARPITPRMPGEPPLRLGFVGRVSPVKNLDYALKVLAGVKVPLTFNIYGPVQDAAYGRQCMQLIAALPGHVRVTFHGEIANDAIPDALAACDLLLLPTKGENFGHAIFEALSCGVPVLISDQTIWRDLTALDAGWDLPLAEPGRFQQAIETFAAMKPADRARLSQGARAVAEAYASANDAVAAIRAMLQMATVQSPAGCDRPIAGAIAS